MISLIYLFKSLKRRLIQWLECPSSYSTLEPLIKRAERRMKIKALCPFCGSEMMFRKSKIEKGIPARDDNNFKCPNCFHTAHFGIPITLKEYEEEFRLRGGKLLMNPSTRFDERENKEVLKRLRDLGYLE